jgi:hypothetical protein
MAIVKDKPTELAPVNDLDDIVDPNEPDAPDDPPMIDEVCTYIVRARCTGKSEKERTDGEMRHGRQLSIQACWEQGKKPPAADDQQPALFDHDDLEGGDDPQTVGEVIDGMNITDNDGYDESGLDEFAGIRPPFSDDNK